MEIEFYPYDFDYKVKEDGVYVYLYARNLCVIHKYKPFFYASLKDVDKKAFIKKLNNLELEFEEVSKKLLGKELPFFKIYTKKPKDVPVISKELQKLGIVCYENDVLFIHRYLRDNKIIPLHKSKAKGKYIESLELRVPIFLAEEVEPLEGITKWNALAVDIETYAENKEINPERNPILMIALYNTNIKKVLTWRKFSHNLPYLETLENEEEMLKRFKELIIEQKPEIITGYFSDGFDFPYLKIRANKYGIKLDVNADFSELMTGNNTDFRRGESKFRGILHIDLLKFVRNIFGGNLKTESYSLNSVAKELIGAEKHDLDINDLARVWYKEPEKLVKYCEYNLQDAIITHKLCNALFPDITEFTRILGLPTFDVIRMRFSRLVENYIMKRAIDHNVIAPNKPSNNEIEQRMQESIQGAFVFEPTPGIYEDVVIFDFRSLYPTIISAHNIGPESFKKENCQDKETVPGREQYWFCKDKKGFLPFVLEDIITNRRKLKQQKMTPLLESRSYALKILANSFYGYLAFYGARWYSFESAASTTAYARDYIMKVIEEAQLDGFKVIYADTDSCFIVLEKKKLKQSMSFMEKINKDLPGKMELEFEGFFPRGIFVGLKGSSRGAKKKYALIKEDGSMKITGFEMVRRNWSIFAKEVQEEVLSLVLNNKNEEAVQYVKQKIEELRKGEVPISKLIIKTQITRELSKYSSISPHVKIAQKLADRGMRIVPGMSIAYVISKGSGLVRDRAMIPEEVTEYDVEYYLKHQLMPAVESILAVLGYSEEELLSGSKQEGLGKFF